jgi:thioesterase domain-containing protein
VKSSRRQEAGLWPVAGVVVAACAVQVHQLGQQARFVSADALIKTKKQNSNKTNKNNNKQSMNSKKSSRILSTLQPLQLPYPLNKKLKQFPVIELQYF